MAAFWNWKRKDPSEVPAQETVTEEELAELEAPAAAPAKPAERSRPVKMT